MRRQDWMLLAFCAAALALTGVSVLESAREAGPRPAPDAAGPAAFVAVAPEPQASRADVGAGLRVGLKAPPESAYAMRGHRKVDLEQLRLLLGLGELSEREAWFYKPEDPRR